jgi:protein gp37
MGRLTGIGWTDATWSPWWGCVEVSPACDNCYARELAARFGWQVWGKQNPRRFFGTTHWHEPFKWDREAERKGIRLKVFPSMCDPFERYSGPDALKLKMTQARGDFWKLIESTPHLDWLLTTKRPQEIRKMVPESWLRCPRPNVWYLVTIESPEYYWRWVELAEIPAIVRGVSYEPALATISVEGMCYPDGRDYPKPDWMILGGESGHKARSFQLDTMALPLIEECRRLGVKTYFKQLGDNFSARGEGPFAGQLVQITGKGDKPEQWPAALRVQDFPGVVL